MSAQPEALRWADELEKCWADPGLQLRAAAKLRHLHEQNADYANIIDGLIISSCDDVARIVALEEQRDELLEALHLALEYWAHREQRYKNRSPVWVQKSREAIAKAGGAA